MYVTLGKERKAAGFQISSHGLFLALVGRKAHALVQRQGAWAIEGAGFDLDR